jgi:hypothetical protein
LTCCPSICLILSPGGAPGQGRPSAPPPLSMEALITGNRKTLTSGPGFRCEVTISARAQKRRVYFL